MIWLLLYFIVGLCIAMYQVLHDQESDPGSKFGSFLVNLFLWPVWIIVLIIVLFFVKKIE